MGEKLLENAQFGENGQAEVRRLIDLVESDSDDKDVDSNNDQDDDDNDDDQQDWEDQIEHLENELDEAYELLDELAVNILRLPDAIGRRRRLDPLLRRLCRTARQIVQRQK